MKQGRTSTTMAGGKVEPNPHAVSVPAVSELGIHQVYIKSKPDLYAGRGYKAPMASSSTHPCGSQGKH